MLFRSGTLDDYQLPFFIEWETSSHPSKDGKALASIEKIELAGNKETIENWLGQNPTEAFEDIEIEWIDEANNEGITGIVAVQLQTPHGKIRVD